PPSSAPPCPPSPHCGRKAAISTLEKPDICTLGLQSNVGVRTLRELSPVVLTTASPVELDVPDAPRGASTEAGSVSEVRDDPKARATERRGALVSRIGSPSPNSGASRRRWLRCSSSE